MRCSVDVVKTFFFFGWYVLGFFLALVGIEIALNGGSGGWLIYVVAYGMSWFLLFNDGFREWATPDGSD